MDILPRQFKTMWFCGVWNEETKFPKLRKIYKIFVLFMIHYFTLAEIIEFFITADNVENFADIYPALTFLQFCFKVINFVYKENDMNEILKNFRDNTFLAKTKEEDLILKKYFMKSQKIFLINVFVEICGIFIILTPLMKHEENTEIELPFKMYHIFDVRHPIIFIGMYIYQSLLNAFSILCTITLDTMVMGFLLITIGQFELCAYRIENFSKKEKISATNSIKDYVKHHVRILDVVKQIEAFFMIIIFPFFFCSLVILCTILFKIAQEDSLFNGHLVTLAQYVTTILSLVFLFCWFGFQVDEKVVKTSYAAVNLMKQANAKGEN
ncbi:uncharacterized protein LOC127285598 isoform X2 [Leptopilina boulardi]|uniref:uncharacterized protein LOC127285598 isoform X2 n=1 Tax=Leptopilina boulardi TaxID=63433 RepID=UPI0021F55D12|nr:uncharacterized protein LOC127285598 isoform X2 [Leptopilina boulardi]